MALTRDDTLLIIARAKPAPATTIPRQPTGDE
jgi:hypothetical protein